MVEPKFYRTGESCLYKIKAKCDAPAVKLSGAFRDDYLVKFLEFNTQDI